MDAHIDWLSFTLETPVEPLQSSDVLDIAKGIANEKTSPELGKAIFNGEGFSPSGSRPPYRYAILRADHGCAIYAGSHTGTVLYEISGTGCNVLRDAKKLCLCLVDIVDRITRIDIACDVRTATRPTLFSNQRDSQRFRSVGFVRSDAGETVYIGSPQSDRYCRVYRYNPPHPRAELLRIEFVARRDMAKRTAEDILSAQGLDEVVARNGNTYGFTHPDWQPEVRTDEKLRAKVVKREREGTVYWLYKQVAPALARCISEGSIELDEFLGQVYSNIK